MEIHIESNNNIVIILHTIKFYILFVWHSKDVTAKRMHCFRMVYL